MPYRHFCIAARALEVVGDRWTLLVVRDLLSGPKRFNELRRLLSQVTPRQLSLRLRSMEADGLVEHREVPDSNDWHYALTDSGRALAPVVHALAAWGAEHAMRPPAEGEPVHPEHLVNGAVALLTTRRVRPPRATRWSFAFPDGARTVEWTGHRWQLGTTDEGARVTVSAEPRDLALAIAEPSRLPTLLGTRITVDGDPAEIALMMSVVVPMDHEKEPKR
ncbi:MAG: helix-turn-helix domain-containing protein [Myxococcota bacterium]